jgi:hypothetical protein
MGLVLLTPKRTPAAALAATALALALAGLTSVAPVPAAWAGEYHVYGCRTPDGRGIPADGWSPMEGGNDLVSDTCERGGGLVAALEAHFAHPADSDLATWAFNAPAGETIVAATLWRAGDTLGGENPTREAFYMFSLTGIANTGPSTHVIEKCQANECSGKGSFSDPFALENRVVVPVSALNSPYLSANAFCGTYLSGNITCLAGGGDENGYAAMIELFAADLVLSQPEGPSVSSVEGGLVASATVAGTSDVAFHATDPGSGVYEAVFRVDGQVVSSPVLDENGGRCRDVGQTTDGLAAFLYTQPCPAALSVDVPFDTTGLSAGAHHLVVSLLDAAGNSATVLDRELTVAGSAARGGGRGPANGSDPSDHALLTARWKGAAGRSPIGSHLSGGYGRVRTVEGRLTGPEGHGIASAQIEASVVPAYTGALPHALPPARTAADGRWSLRLPPASSSCTLRLAYRSHLGDPLPAATRTLTLSVRPALVLRIRPRVAGAGATIFFSGRLRGGPIPPGGKQLVLEAASPGSRWIEFHVIRTDSRGRFRFSYRFRLPGPVTYRFRARSEYEADFPFTAGDSNVVRVFER